MAIKTLYVFLGLIIGVSSSLVLNYVDASFFTGLSSVEIIEEQQDALKYTGNYVSDVTDPNTQVHTYEAPCKGFYIIEKTDTDIVSTGFGDLAEQYTYTEKITYVDTQISSSTKETEIIDIEPVATDTPTTNDNEVLPPDNIILVPDTAIDASSLDIGL